MAKNELLPFANGEDANVLPTNQWEALTDILENGFQSGIARSEQVNRVLAQGAVASYVLGQLIVDQLNKDATLDKDTLYQNIVKALQENAKDACLPLIGGMVNGNVTIQHGYRGLVQKLPANAVYTDHAFLDSDGDLYGNIRVTKDANGKCYIGISANGKDASGATIWRTLEVGANGDGSSPFIRFNGDAVLTAKTGLPLGGGIMAGNVSFSQQDAILYKRGSNGCMTLRGGTTYNDCGSIYLYGSNYSDANYKGGLKFVANNGTNNAGLILLPDGTATWKGEPIQNPVGTVIAYASNSAPAGYLLCNGATVSRTTYAKLFEKIGTTYGAGDGSTTFNLPNLTDKFIQGSGTAGTVKSAGLPNITGSIRAEKEFRIISASGAFIKTCEGQSGSGDVVANSYHGFDFDASKSNAIYGASDTVQPPALTMRHYIKY